MADEENNSSGKIAGGLAGAAAGIAVISNPQSVLTMLGVSSAAPAVSGGLMTVAATAAAPAAAISGGAILALAIVAGACIAVGVYAGGFLMKAARSVSSNAETAVSTSSPATPSGPALSQEQEMSANKHWAKTVESERASIPASKGIGGI